MQSTETYWRAVLLVRNEAISGASHGRFAGPVVAIAVAAARPILSRRSRLLRSKRPRPPQPDLFYV